MAKKIPDSIYCRLIKLTRQKEDFFTESLAFALQENAAFCKKFLEVIIGSSIPDLRLEDAQIQLHTQVSLPFSKIDMVFIINETLHIAVENKLWSKEGGGQLKKYLNHDQLHYLAFITAESGYSIEDSVVNNIGYLRPENRKHFIWQDFLPIIHELAVGSEVAFSIAELRSLCHYLGFLKSVTPASVPTVKPVDSDSITTIKPIDTASDHRYEIKDKIVYDRKSIENIFTIQSSTQQRFQQIIKSTPGLIDNLLSHYGWGSQGKKSKEIGNKHGQIYAYPVEDHEVFDRLYITPAKEGSAVRIRFSIKDASVLDELAEKLESELENKGLVFEALIMKREKYLEYAVPIPDLPDEDSDALKTFAGILEEFISVAKTP